MGIGTFVNQPRSSGANDRKVKVGRGDIILLAAVAALCIIGLLMVYSSSVLYSLSENENPYLIFNKQVLFMLLGAIGVFVISRFKYQLIQKVVVYLMVASIIMLVVVLIKGEERLFSMRSFTGGSVQPAEFAKLITVLYLAVWLNSKREYLHNIQLGLIPLAVILGLIGGLILRQPDISAAATIFIIGGLLFFLAEGDLKQIFILLVVALIVGFFVIQLSNTGKSRIDEYINGLKDPLQSSDHMLFSLESIVQGGFFGKGIGNAAVKAEGLPMAPTDSIFAVIVEELGLLGAIVLMGLYGIVLWRGLKISMNAPDPFGKILAGGLSCWIVIEALMHMAVLVGLIPFAGNVLPFIGAGGSNLLTMLAAIGILYGISRQRGVKPSESIVDERRSFSASVDLRRRDRRRRVSR